MKCIAKLNQGSVFGEKGLDQNIPRSATCICLEDCHFGVIQKTDYIKVLQEVSRLQTEKNQEFFMN
jgi:CRP-like cAMP-binding protein